MAKKYINKTVYDSALERVEYIFHEFENILVAFSGGKDSTVILNVFYDYAVQHNLTDRLAMYHMDYEAQYQSTTDFVDETFKKFPIKKYWLCLPIEAQCCCSVKQGSWTVWEQSKKDIWVRPMPSYPYVVNESNAQFDFHGSDYDVMDRFCKWYAEQNGKTAVIVGIRADESLNRFRAIASDKVEKYKDCHYINGNKCYPIYDWSVEDVWTYLGKFSKPYNKLYDLYYQVGLSIDQMRVASPFNHQAGWCLKLYRTIDPNTWGRMVGRVNGVNFTALYGGTTAMGWKSITKPDHFTWKEYCYFLLDTLDEKTREHYLEKLNTSIKFWKEKGGALSDETLAELGEYEQGQPSKISAKTTVKFAEYPDDLPDVTNFREVPSYKRMCVCIMKNDYFCKYMGFAQTKEELTRRRAALEKYKEL